MPNSTIVNDEGSSSNIILNDNNEIKVDINYKLSQEQNQITDKNIIRAINNSNEHIINVNCSADADSNESSSSNIKTFKSNQDIIITKAKNNNDNDNNSSNSNDTGNTNIASLESNDNNDSLNNNSRTHLNPSNREPSASEGLNVNMQYLQNFYRYISEVNNDISNSPTNNTTSNNITSNNTTTNNTTSNNTTSNNTTSNNNDDFIRNNVTIEQLENALENNQPSQVGPGQVVWLLFRIYSILKFSWSFSIALIYIILFMKFGNNSCDIPLYHFSIVFAVIQGVQAFSTLLLIKYLPTCITRYTISQRRRVVISEKAWHLTMLTFIVEMIMIVVGTILLFNKSPICSIESNTGYVTITKVIIICVLIFYSIFCFPIFVLPCFFVFKLLPEYKGISRKAIRKFSNVTYTPNENETEEDAPSCSICMETYKPGTRIKRLPCNHEFHPDCITLWLETNNSCPICRQSF